jgi:acyl carrier protein
VGQRATDDPCCEQALRRSNIVTDAEIEKKVIDIVAQHTDAEPESITRETSFTNDLNADSLDIVELLMEFENQFGTKIPDDQAEKIHTVGQAIDFIKANRKA